MTTLTAMSSLLICVARVTGTKEGNTRSSPLMLVKRMYNKDSLQMVGLCGLVWTPASCASLPTGCRRKTAGHGNPV